jgi:hypothetical protein
MKTLAITKPVPSADLVTDQSELAAQPASIVPFAPENPANVRANFADFLRGFPLYFNVFAHFRTYLCGRARTTTPRAKALPWAVFPPRSFSTSTLLRAHSKPFKAGESYFQHFAVDVPFAVPLRSTFQARNSASFHFVPLIFMGGGGCRCPDRHLKFSIAPIMMSALPQNRASIPSPGNESRAGIPARSVPAEAITLAKKTAFRSDTRWGLPPIHS